jgi:hypothetical protein
VKVTLAPDKLVDGLNDALDPLGLMLQVTPALSFVVAVSVDSVSITVSAARWGEIETVIPEALIVSVRFTDCVRTGLLESVTWNVSGVLVAVAVGVPVMAPLDAFSDRPVGSVPLVSDHV